MPALKAPVTTADLNILYVKDQGPRIIIGPRMGAGGFRHADLLVELKFVQHWLENRCNVEQVLIDIAGHEYLRGRTLAGLVMLKDHLPEGAEFAVCGESQLLQAILAKMQVRGTVPVFENTQSAFLPAPRWPIREALKQTRATLVARRTTLLRIAAALVALIALVALAPLIPSRLERDFHRLLSTWDQLQTLRADKPGSPELTDFQQNARQAVAGLGSDYRTLPHRSAVQDLMLQAADALYENLRASGGDEASEEKFVQTMQALADELQIGERPTRSSDRRPEQRPLQD